MATKTQKIILGILMLVILTSSAYVIFNQNELKISVEKTKTTFYTNQTGLFEVAGVEYNSIYNGTKKLTVSSTNISILTEVIQDKNEIFIYRIANYPSGLIVKDTYFFNGSNNKQEDFPVYHTIEIKNAKNMIFEYKVNRLTYSGGTVKNPKSPQSFGKNMKVTWQDGNYYSNLAKLTAGGELKVRYKINSNDEIYNVRLFDPIIFGPELNGGCSPGNVSTSDPTINVTCNFTTNGGGVSNVNYSFNGANNNYYDGSLLFWMNSDNRSALGETDSNYASWGNGNGNTSGSLNFNGVTSLNIANLNTLTRNSTLSLWVNTLNWAQAVIYLADARNSTGTGWWFLMNHVSAPCTGSGVCFNGLVEANSGNFTNGQWANIVIVMNDTKTYIYVNGILASSGNAITSTYNYNTVGLGTRYTKTSYFTGQMDEIRIYNRTLNSTEISDLYSHIVDNRTGLINELMLNSTSGNTAVDTSGNNLNGTILGAGMIADLSLYSNNAFVKNNSIFNSTRRNGNGAYELNASAPNMIFAPYITTYNMTQSNKITITGWIYLNNLMYNSDFYGLIDRNGYRPWGIIMNNNSLNAGFNILNASFPGGDDTAYRKALYFGNLPIGQWVFIAGTYSNETGYMTVYKYYANGTLYTTSSNVGKMSILDSTDTISIGCKSTGMSGCINGSIDEVRIYNRSLSATEIDAIHSSQLTKFNLTAWEFDSTQTLNYSSRRLNSTTPTYNNLYKICVTNSTSIESCSAINDITQTISNMTVTSNFSTSNGFLVNNKFGFNIHSISYFTTDSQAAWHRDKWNNITTSKFGRIDQSLDSFWIGPYNFDLEAYKNIYGNYTDRTYHEIAYGFGVSWQFANGTAARTTDAHTGTYALQVNSTQGGLYIDKGEKTSSDLNSLYIADGHQYNISFWAKGQGTFSGALQRQEGAYSQCGGIGTTSLSTSWTQYSFICDAPSNPNMTTYRFALNVVAGSNLTFDDFNITDTATGSYPAYWIRNNNTIATWQTRLDWLISTGSKAEIITSYMPVFMANLSHPGCNITYSYNDCPAKDNDLYGRLNKMWFDYITVNGTRYDMTNFLDESWNEPEGGFFMRLYSSNNLVKVNAYIDMTNSTFFYMNQSYPTVKLLAPALAGNGCSTPAAYLMMNYSLTNFSTYSQFEVSGHCYQSPLDPWLESGTTQLKALCSQLGVTCNGVWWDEYNLGFGSYVTSANLIKNTTSRFNEWNVAIVSSLIRMWRLYPDFAHVAMYQWTDNCNYGSGCGEYPARWSSVSSPNYENTTYPPYWAIMNISKLCPDGTEILDTLSSNSDITTLGCKNGNQYGIIVANEVDKSQRVILNFSRGDGTMIYPYNKISKYGTSESYSISNGIADAGIIDGFGVFYLVRDTVIDYQIELPLALIRFQYCSPDWENPFSNPSGQNESIAAINVTNTGLGAKDFFINLTGALNTGWTIFAANDTKGYYHFDGTSNYVNISDSASLNISNMTNGITLEAWINMDNYGCFRRIVSKSPLINSPPYTTYALDTDCNTSSYGHPGIKGVRMELASGNHQYLIRSTASLNSGQWYHLVGTFNKTDGARLYINGVLDNSTFLNVTSYSPYTEVVLTDFTGFDLDTNNNSVAIGAQYTPSSSPVTSNYFKGSIDEVRIYNRSLSASEVAARYAYGRTESNDAPTGLVSLWHLGEEGMADHMGLNNGINFGAFKAFDNTIQLNTTAQRIIFNVGEGQSGKIWLQANCSYVSANPGRSIEVFGG